MTLSLFRNMVIGETLKATLEEMIEKNMITRYESERIFEKFDQVFPSIFIFLTQQVMIKSLEGSKTNKTTIKVSLSWSCIIKQAQIDTYNNSESIWTFHLKNASVRTDHETITCERLKIVTTDKVDPDEQRGKKGGKGKKKERKKSK